MQPGPVISADLTLLDPIMLAAAGWQMAAGRERKCRQTAVMREVIVERGWQNRAGASVRGGGGSRGERRYRAAAPSRTQQPPRPARPQAGRLETGQPNYLILSATFNPCQALFSPILAVCDESRQAALLPGGGEQPCHPGGCRR